MALIELRKVSKRFDQLVVLDQIDLNIEAGKCLAVIGASGVGKSVLLKHIVGLLRPDSGEIYFAGQRIDNLSERQLDEIRHRFGFLFQMGALFDSMTVAENIGFPLVEHTKKSSSQIAAIVQEKLSLVGLPEIGQRLPGELSGGQRKRVALARAIALGPEVILYDEPTTGLDPIRSDVINELIIKLQRELAVTSIVVTHDMHSVFRVADRIVMLDNAKFVFDGSTKEIRHSQNQTVRHFVEGKATQAELGTLKAYNAVAD
ncbi:MAG TPA: ABC transporter ATP-binding protein [Tepidisphaeraceae bacterium]|nr:ABC transporter ATP-binding protein [Tepidisphaeraceae bacterium]